jgi:hypothetical protein
MSGVLTVEADALAAYHQAVQRAKEKRRAIEQFRKSYQEAKRAAEALGAEPPPTLALADIAELGERPRIAVLDGSAPQIRLALSGNTGVFVLDQRRMPTTSVVNNNHDDAGRLLNEAAAGYPLAVAGPKGRRDMRSLPAAVVGALRLTDDTLDRLTAMQLTSTIFVPAVALPVTSERGALVGLMKQVHAFGREAVVLRLPSGVEEFLRAAESWTLLAATCSPPLSHYYACLPDLACRLAATMHLASTAANGSGLHPHIPPAMVKRAVAIAERFVKPVGRALLEPASAAQDERDARRIIAYALKVASPDNPSFDRRPLLRSKAKSIPSAQRLDAGLRFLRTAGLIAPIGASKGQRFEVSSEIFDLN